MPIHDWTKVGPNRFHDFHQGWIIGLRNALNRGILPTGYSAMAEQVTGGPEPDVVTLSLPGRRRHAPVAMGTALANAPIRTRHQAQAEAIRYADKADRVVIYHPDGLVVAVIEIVSPGNKSSARAIKTFAVKAERFLRAGVNLLIVDLFPPTKRDPQGLHKLIWDRIEDAEFELPPDKPLTLVSYLAGGIIRAFVEPVGPGDPMPDMPVFLDPDHYVMCPLDTTYQESWSVFPQALKAPLEA